jgi:hypothetical protein
MCLHYRLGTHGFRLRRDEVALAEQQSVQFFIDAWFDERGWGNQALNVGQHAA